MATLADLDEFGDRLKLDFCRADHVSQLRSIAFTLMRINLGNTRLSRPSKAEKLGTGFSAVLAAAVERLKSQHGHESGSASAYVTVRQSCG